MSPNNADAPLVLRNPNSDRPVAEVFLITRSVRLFRSFRVILFLLLLGSAYGAGVFTGTSGMYSDGISELRRMVGSENGDSSIFIRAINVVSQLDAAEGVEGIKTRHGVAQSLDGLNTMCAQQLSTTNEELQAAFRTNFRSATREFWQGVDMLSKQLEALNVTATNTAELAALAELDCGRTHQQLGEILGVRPAPKKVLNSQGTN